MKLLGKDPRVEQAMKDWREIAPGLGLDSGAFKHKLIWQKDERARSHIVLRLKGPQTLILKRVFRTPPGDDLIGTTQALQNAFESLQNVPNAHAPQVLFASPDCETVVMTEASGKALDEHLASGRNATPLLRRTGAWLAAFHRAGKTETRTYQPKFMVRHANRMVDQVKAGDLVVPEPDAFIACCEIVPELAAQFEGYKTVSAIKHGDFNVRNILLGPAGETGLDFKPASNAPVGFDIARILMDYAELYQPIEQVRQGQVLADDTFGAFFAGYTLVFADDPAVRFVPFIQLLNDWRLIPVDPAKRSWRQVKRYEMIKNLRRTGFGVA